MLADLTRSVSIITRMRIFVTGASGFVGSAVVPELLRAGHQVVGLARSDASASAVKAAGADVLRGDLVDPDILKRGASSADGVIHVGFIHDFANYAKSAETDRAAIQAMAAALTSRLSATKMPRRVGITVLDGK